MYALINEMSAIANVSIGHALSRHRTIEAALRAQAQVQRDVRRGNPGSGSYLPTRIVRVVAGEYLECADAVSDVRDAMRA